MSIKNTRQSIVKTPSEDRLKNKLKENVRRFLKEDEDEELIDDEDTSLSDDSEIDGSDLGDDLADDSEVVSDDMDGLSFDDLTDSEAGQVDDWTDTLLQSNLDGLDVDDTDPLSAETDADDLDPLGTETTINDELPISVSELTDIIDSDDSLHALEQTLVDLSQEELGDDLDDEDGLEDNPFEDESADEELEEGADPNNPGEKKSTVQKIKKFYQDEISPKSVKPGGKYFGKHDTLPSNIGEAEEMTESDEFTQGYEGKDVKDELQEEVALAPSTKELEFEETAEGLNDKGYKTVTQKSKPSDRSTEDIAKDVAGVVQESVKKSRMLVAAAAAIAKFKKMNEASNKKIEALKLENYRLIKANGLLAVAGDKLSSDARIKISESFDKCDSVEKINGFYKKMVEAINNGNKSSKPSLNESIKIGQNQINVVKESTEKIVSSNQQRKNMLMGLDTENDVYFK